MSFRENRQRPLLNDKQCRLFMNDVRDFGYQVTFDEIRKIADEVHSGTWNRGDPVAMLLCNQIDDAMDMIKSRGRK